MRHNAQLVKMKRKIDAMHERFGVIQDKRCEDCDNLIKGYCGNTFVRKCTVYGATHSEASDWRKKYIACGMFNKEWSGYPIIRVLKRNGGFKSVELPPIDGQESLFDADE